jgi:hypothetical protein
LTGQNRAETVFYEIGAIMKYLLIVAVLVLALTALVRGFNIAYDCGENGYVEDGQCVYE